MPAPAGCVRVPADVTPGGPPSRQHAHTAPPAQSPPPPPPRTPRPLTGPRPCAPQDEAHTIIQRRFPTPRFTDCDQNGSQARFLLAKLNPSATYNTSSSMSSEIIMTDDVSLLVRPLHSRQQATRVEQDCLALEICPRRLPNASPWP